MVRTISINRDMAELLVTVLEDTYRAGKFGCAGKGVDFASELRELFGMGEQPELIYESTTIQ